MVLSVFGLYRLFEPFGRIRFVYVSFVLIDPIWFDLPLLNWFRFDLVKFDHSLVSSVLS